MLSRRKGMRVLNVSDFRAEHSNGWDFSSFVHAYGRYLDNRLDCSSFGSFGARRKSSRRPSFKTSKYDYSDSTHHSDDYDLSCTNSEMRDFETEKSRSFKDMKLSELLETFPLFQRLLEKVVACRPTGPAKVNRLVNVALYGVIRESFVLYADVQEGLNILHDAYIHMDSPERAKVLAIYVRAAKQMEELDSFFNFCKDLELCKRKDYPVVEAVSGTLLDEMENLLRDAGRHNREVSPESGLCSTQKEGKHADFESRKESPDLVEETSIPMPEVKPSDAPIAPVSNDSAIFVDIQQPTISQEELSNKLALALFTTSHTNVEEKWNPFQEADVSHSHKIGASNSTTGWELALTESQSEVPKQSQATLAGGFDHLLLESLYDQGDLQNAISTAALAGSASSVALSSRPASNFLALPAPPGASDASFCDPFSASESVPPPTYVQMSDMEHKQHLLVQEQQEWIRFQQGGMQGFSGLNKSSTNPFAGPFQPAAYSIAYHKSNPFCV
ncbi:hypothetical protein KP509_04G022700 [Ceratopteris richardii]|nr:hypothetical protein KP509_04G022700 [Ceratopteris richardii]